METDSTVKLIDVEGGQVPARWASCLICGLTVRSWADLKDSYWHDCPRCSRWGITRTGAQILMTTPLTQLQVPAASGWVRERGGKRLEHTDVDRLRSLRNPSVGEKGEKILRYLATRFPTPGEAIQIDATRDMDLLSVGWASGPSELGYLLRAYLEEARGFLGSVVTPKHPVYRVTIAPDGWAYLDDLRRGKSDGSIGFVAMWFDGRLDSVRDEAILPAIADAGYEPKIMTQHEHVNRIDDEILALIRRARFMVADFTGARGGVYFEAGFAQGLSIPVIWTCRKGTIESGDLHFDVEHFNFLVWEEGQLERFRGALRNRIEAVIGLGPLEPRAK